MALGRLLFCRGLLGRSHRLPLAIADQVLHPIRSTQFPTILLKDFEPISPLATGPVVLVARKTMPAQKLSELIAWLKAYPNQASAGMNTLLFRLLACAFKCSRRRNLPLYPIARLALWLGI
jgi:hypothetical protein